MNRLLGPGVAVAIGAAFLMAVAGTASAHEERTVGPYDIEVGFGEEPAYAGVENSVVMLIHRDGQPVTDLAGTLQVEVRYGDQTMAPMTMEPNFEEGEFGTPGDYRAFFFPTRPGDYEFHFTGTIGNQTVDESFTSAPDTFSSVQDSAAVQFPAKDPTTGQLSQRLDREAARLRTAAQTAAAAARDRADSARTLALVAIGLGGLAVVLGVVAIVTSRRRLKSAPPVESVRPAPPSGAH